jgi:hypothetical protein
MNATETTIHRAISMMSPPDLLNRLLRCEAVHSPGLREPVIG